MPFDQQGHVYEKASDSVTRLGRFASVFVAIQAAVGFVLLIPGALQSYWDSISRDWGTLAMGMVSWGLWVALLLTAVITFLIWIRRAAINVRLLHPEGGVFYTPTECIVWWFIPLGNLLQPFKAMHELWHFSDPGAPVDPRTGQTTQIVRGRRAPPLLSAWWAAWLSSLIVFTILSVSESLAWLAPSSFLYLSAGVLCVLVIRKVTAMQRESLVRFGEGVISRGGHVVGSRAEPPPVTPSA